jgi:hypothetical protein
MRDSPYQPTTTTAAEEKPRIALNTTVAASMAGGQAAIDVLLVCVGAQAVLNERAIMKKRRLGCLLEVSHENRKPAALRPLHDKESLVKRQPGLATLR